MRDPIFVVAPPRSGGVVLAEAFRRSTGVHVATGALDHAIAAHCGARERLTEDDATAEIATALREAMTRTAGDQRLLDASPLHAQRVPFLRAVFPGATFVYIYRDPRRAIYDSDEALPAEELARGWAAMTAQLLDDLQRLPPGKWTVAAWHALFERPDLVLARIADFVGIDWDGTVPPRAEPQPTPSPEVVAQLNAVDAITHAVADRARELFAAPPPRARDATSFRSVSTQSFPNLLRQLGVSLIVSTYQSGRLILLRAESDTQLNTHFRMFRSPMGVAVGDGRIAIGTEREVWDYRNMPAVAAKLEPSGTYDACYVPRKVHVTGDIRIHEVGYAEGELWMVNTRFSTLCTLDQESSFVPRWRPPFVTHLAAEDRCHLNGMTIIENRVRYVTALGTTNTAGGWRATKASGGVLMEVPSGEIVLRGLSMPHSPRQYNGRFFILESGKGTLATADLASGRVETIAELPGFTRGLAFFGPFAFVGLSQVRESNIFGGLPLTERVAQRECGVYVIDLRSGQTVAFLRFEGDVQEIFDVQVLPRHKFPDLLELTDPRVGLSFSIPDAFLQELA